MRGKLSGLLLFICLIFPFVGGYLLLKWQQWEVRLTVKHELIATVDPLELVKIQLPKEDLNQLIWEHRKEFEYLGQMYDVVSSVETSDSMTYWCWWDHEETALNQKLNNLVASALGANPHRGQTQDHLVLLLKTPSLLQTNLYFFSNGVSNTLKVCKLFMPVAPVLAKFLAPPQA